MLETYRHKVSAEDLQHDPDQERVAKQLAALRYNILHNAKIGKEGCRGLSFLGGLLPGVLSPSPRHPRGVSQIRSNGRDPVMQKSPKGFFNIMDSVRAKALQACQRNDGRSVKGLYIWGGVGRGKSMLMDMFFADLPPEIKARRVHFHEFMIGVHEFLHEARKASKDKDGADQSLLQCAEKIASESRILCFDEFHVTDIADAMILGRLFTALFEKGVIVIATSNWPPDRLYEGGLQRDLFKPFIVLLKSKMTVTELNGSIDYRLQCLSETGVYFHPLGKETTKNMDDVFARLTEGATPYEEMITVKGRDLSVPSVAKGVARLSFAALCEKPLGAEDYLMLAKSYHTVFVEDIPHLGDENRNEAKRFMTLIDALYEQGTKLVASAENPANQIYSGHDHEYEFQRTVSRLIEMQGEEYLMDGA